MADNAMQPAPTGVDQAGFLNSSLNAVPRWAAATIGTMLGAAIAIVFVLVIGGMQGPVTRLANAYAARVEESANKTDKASDKLEKVTERLIIAAEKVGRLEATLNAVVVRLDRIETGVAVANDRVARLEQRVLDLERRPAREIIKINRR